MLLESTSMHIYMQLCVWNQMTKELVSMTTRQFITPPFDHGHMTVFHLRHISTACIITFLFVQYLLFWEGRHRNFIIITIFFFSAGYPFLHITVWCIRLACAIDFHMYAWENSFKCVNCRIVHTNIHEDDAERQRTYLTLRRTLADTLISYATQWTAMLQNSVWNSVDLQVLVERNLITILCVLHFKVTVQQNLFVTEY